ncbi:MAG: T9SS type A sorting domain-containing protein [Cryomorphaceae bacterium]|nr:T9SS type A sorting domain-containing protein [Cryomorphaceae bacterium]
MFKSFTISLFFLFNVAISFGQYQIGHTTITFNDPSRTGGFGSGGGSGRQIQTEIYYPATVAGDNVSSASGTFPVIVFGHGFAMAWDAYQNIWEHYVSLGYILAFPRTEGSLIPSPSHSDFGLDLALVGQRMQAEIAAASSVSVPAVIYSGTSDGVTPPADHHIPIYNGLNSSCKTLVNIIGGAHCYFANTNFNCDFGEATSSTGISISREQQQATTFASLDFWLEYKLKGNPSSLESFLNILESAPSTELSYESTCQGFLNFQESNELMFNPYPNPVEDLLHLPNGMLGEVELMDAQGRVLLKVKNVTSIDVSSLENGMYYLRTSHSSTVFLKR